jgi:hypothetical protein
VESVINDIEFVCLADGLSKFRCSLVVGGVWVV